MQAAKFPFPLTGKPAIFAREDQYRLLRHVVPRNDTRGKCRAMTAKEVTCHHGGGYAKLYAVLVRIIIP